MKTKICIVYQYNFILALSYNQPQICWNATWNPNATTFANVSIVGELPRAIFIDHNNSVYVAAHKKSQILVFLEGNSNLTILPDTPIFENGAISVSTNGDVYFEKDAKQG